MVITLASGYSHPGFRSLHSQKNLEVKIVGIAEVNQRRCLEESGQWLENVEDASSLSLTQLSSIQC